MPIPPPSYLRLQVAHRRGDHLTVLAEGDAVAAELNADPAFGADHERWLRDLAFTLGAAHAAYERLAVACTYLEFGLASPAATTGAAPGSADDAARAPGRFGNEPPVGLATATIGADDAPSGPFSTRGIVGATGPANPFGATRATGVGVPATPTRVVTGKLDTSDTDWAELLLLDLYAQLGRYDDALARITSLLEPGRPTTTRFTATRAQAAIAALRGDDETAHVLLNTATGLANRVPSHFRVALVEADRSMVLAAQGRTREAVSIADRLLGKLVRPAVGAHQLWSNAEAAAIALTISRAVAHEGDLLTAQRLLRVGEQAAAPLDRVALRAHAALTRGVLHSAGGDHDRAESSFVEALRAFNDYGYRPAAAATLLEQGRLAHRRGLVQSARLQYERAIDELRELGAARELRVARQLLAALDAGRPPTLTTPGGPGTPFPRYPSRT